LASGCPDHVQEPGQQSNTVTPVQAEPGRVSAESIGERRRLLEACPMASEIT
jgi:hypothetical protein